MKINKKFTSVCFSAMLLLAACAEKELTANEYIASVAGKEEFNKRQEMADFVVTCSYRPAEWLALKELGTAVSSKSQYEQELNKFNNALYFDFIIAPKDKKNIVLKNVNTQQDYAGRISELTYNMSSYVYALVEPNDTLRPLIFNFNNTYGSVPEARFIIAFPKKGTAENKDKITIAYDDKIFGIREPVRFEFSHADLNRKLPLIKELK